MNKYYTGLTALIAATFLFGFNPQNTTKEGCANVPASWSAARPLRVDDLGVVGVVGPWGVWEPSLEDVRAMEERLPVFLGSNEALHAVSAVESAGRWLLVQGSLRNYVRVYCGGRLRPREMHVWFTYSAAREPSDAVGALRVDGGGDQFFDVTYQTATGRVLNLRVNAPY